MKAVIALCFIVMLGAVTITAALYPVENCPKSRDTSKSPKEQCIQQAACLRVGAIHMYLDHSTRSFDHDSMSDNDVLGLFCRNMDLFDEAVIENLLYLRELGCDEVGWPLLDTVSQEYVMTSTSEFWTRSRSFLHSIYKVVCTRTQNEVCPNDDLLPYIKAFAECFDSKQAGSWDMFPATHYNRRWLCEFVYGQKNCTDVHAIARPCGGTSQAETVTNMNEQFGRIAEFADCESLRLH